MNCEQVEEQLSAYLDGALALEETEESAYRQRLSIEAHLENCPRCRAILADYQRFDALLTQMPRVVPTPALRDRIFSSAEYLEMTGIDPGVARGSDKEQTVPYRSVRRDTLSRPQLVALPGGRGPSLSGTGISSSRLRAAPPLPKRRGVWGLRAMQIAIAAVILLTLGVSSLIGRNLWLQSNTPATVNKAITPPVGPAQTGPLSAGMRFVFLRNGMLWSTPADGSSPAEQLTPKSSVVGTYWAVSPPLPGHSAGDVLAYIDLQQALIHTIRSDGQRDAIVQQPLLKAGIAPSSVWDTETGEAILNSLAWSKDGSMLAFVADPKGTGSTSLYIFSLATRSVQVATLPMKGSVSHPTWSPDGIRVAFELTNNGATGILDYNTQNRGLLIITNKVNEPAYPNDTVLTLDWAADTDTPAITWSAGVTGHIHSIWLRHVGFGESAAPQVLVRGDFAQAVYSRNGPDGAGSWLLRASFLGRAANLWWFDITSGTGLIALTSGKEVNFAQWSSDGTQVDYLNSISSGVGALHIINMITLVDTFVAQGVMNEPAPAWSEDGQRLVFSTAAQTVVATISENKKLQLQPLKLRGSASTFTWSAILPGQLIVALNDGQEGTYLVDTQHNAAQQIDSEGINGPILWTEVP